MLGDPKFVSDERFRNAAYYARKHSISFLEEIANGTRIHLWGSGTLITFDGEAFILTATHVWNEIRSKMKICITLVDDRPHKTEIYTAAFTAYSLDGYVENHPMSADMTLLRIDPVVAKLWIGYRLPFYHIQNEKRGLAELPNDYIMAGTPGELTSYAVNDPTILNGEWRATSIPGAIQYEEFSDLGLDFYEFEPRQDPAAPLHKYNGYSGGGLWELSYVPDETALERIRYELHFCGVLFLQREEDSNGVYRKVRALCRKAIQSMLDKYRKERP